ncbi:bifunctional helix-turn-helix transcriptional regulator/GNAT family N-acetyltransferase [Elongatibacter sediminis]|uniref:Helix-turn-helix domain-containing GNAT family N-acetyltransferase n=1 Tax=Elongatibacter sediminis TaxID=3119006 RepID=A0AAW9RKS0_9GAMM
MSDLVSSIRRASREMVRELHLLDSRHCFDGHSVSECHLLTELEVLGEAAASELGERLVLEKSTVSRLVAGLEQRGEIRAGPDPGDGRRRLLSLTNAGRRALRRIHGHADDLVVEALAFMAPGEREAVVAGLDRYARALRYARAGRDFRIRPIRRADNPAVARIIRDVMTEFGAVGPGYSIEDPEVDAMYQSYPAPGSAFFVIEQGDRVLGCGGLGPLAGGDSGVCELRKMYFRQELRGTGLGTRLLGMILEAARTAGYRQCYLETLESMGQARRLYEKHGFAEIDGALGATGHSGCNRFMLADL